MYPNITCDSPEKRRQRGLRWDLRHCNLRWKLQPTGRARRRPLVRYADRDNSTPFRQTNTPFLQRRAQCPCGGSCPRCQAKFNLKIGEPGDAAKREADAVADQVMRMRMISDPHLRHAVSDAGAPHATEAHELTHVVQQARAEAIRLDQSDEKRGLSPLRGHGEEPKPAEPAAPRGSDPSSSPPAGPSCRCSNLRLGEDVYQNAQKNVKLLFDVEPGADPHQCVLVQSVIGEKYLSFTPEPKTDEKIHPVSIAILGTPQLFNFSEWQIDSTDKDSVVWSKPGSRWNYQGEGEHTFYATDSPSVLAPYPPEGARFAVSAAKFRTSLYLLRRRRSDYRDLGVFAPASPGFRRVGRLDVLGARQGADSSGIREGVLVVSCETRGVIWRETRPGRARPAGRRAREFRAQRSAGTLRVRKNNRGQTDHD